MLPTWLQSKRPAEEQEAEAQPKSKSRFQVDLKARKLDQFKTFLEPEEVVRPINPLADYINQGQEDEGQGRQAQDDNAGGQGEAQI